MASYVRYHTERKTQEGCVSAITAAADTLLLLPEQKRKTDLHLSHCSLQRLALDQGQVVNLCPFAW